MENLTSNINITQASLSDAEAITRVNILAWQQSYRGIISDEYLDTISFEDLLSFRKRILTTPADKSIHLIATFNGELIGYSDAGSCHDASHSGEIYTLYLLEQYKHHGIGSMLFEQVHAHLVKHSLTPYIAWVLKENLIARRFYEKWGGELFQEQMVDIGGREYLEVGYEFLRLGG